MEPLVARFRKAAEEEARTTEGFCFYQFTGFVISARFHEVPSRERERERGSEGERARGVPRNPPQGLRGRSWKSLRILDSICNGFTRSSSSSAVLFWFANMVTPGSFLLRN